jgi:hypothetical protein
MAGYAKVPAGLSPPMEMGEVVTLPVELKVHCYLVEIQIRKDINIQNLFRYNRPIMHTKFSYLQSCAVVD